MKLVSRLLGRKGRTQRHEKPKRQSVVGAWTQLSTGGTHHRVKTDVGVVFDTFCGREGSNNMNTFVWLNPETFEGTSVKLCKTCLKASKEN